MAFHTHRFALRRILAMSSLSKVAVVDIGTTFFSPLLPNFTFFSRIHSRFGAATPLPRKIDRVAQRTDDSPFRRNFIQIVPIDAVSSPRLGQSQEEELRRGEIDAGQDERRRRRRVVARCVVAGRSRVRGRVVAGL